MGCPPFAHMSFISSGPAGQRNVIFSPAENEPFVWHPDEASAKEFYHSVDDFLPLLSYDHGNKVMLDQTISQIIRLWEERPTEPKSDKFFTITANFLRIEGYTDLGPALILWLRLVIEQQAKKRKVWQTDATLAEWLRTTRKTILVYKRQLQELGYLNIDTSKRPQRLSVRYFPK